MLRSPEDLRAQRRQIGRLTLLAIGLAGCGVDPCAGIAGTCIPLRLLGPGSIDQVELRSKDLNFVDKRFPADDAARPLVALPIIVALAPGDFSGPFTVDLWARAGDVWVGSARVQGDVSSGEHAPTVPVTLTADGPDGSAPDDLAGKDVTGLAPPDLTGVAPPDMSGARPPDLTTAPPGDLADPTPHTVPAHFPSLAPTGTCDLVIKKSIHTSAFTVDGATPSSACLFTFALSGSTAALTAQSVTVMGNVRVMGSNPLVIVAKTITIAGGATLDASAHLSVPGPGGSAPTSGAGAGQMGARDSFTDNVNDFSYTDGGGGGASYGGVGGRGGTGTATSVVDGRVIATAVGGIAGRAYPIGDDGLIAGVPGGSGGGEPGRDGLSASACNLAMLDGGTGAIQGAGGGGGGSVQLSATVSMIIGGTINVGGGGGGGGCFNNNELASAGGGGGSGGAIFLDSKSITIQSGTILAANGGGGGGAADYANDPHYGGPGGDGPASDQQATGGGPGGAEASGGGLGGALGVAATQGDDQTSQDRARCGGGGGGVGRIVVRTHGKLSYSGSVVISPNFVNRDEL